MYIISTFCERRIIKFSEAFGSEITNQAENIPTEGWTKQHEYWAKIKENNKNTLDSITNDNLSTQLSSIKSLDNYSVKKNDTLSGILKNRVGLSGKYLLMALVNLKLEKNINIDLLKVGEKISVTNDAQITIHGKTVSLFPNLEGGIEDPAGGYVASGEEEYEELVPYAEEDLSTLSYSEVFNKLSEYKDDYEGLKTALEDSGFVKSDIYDRFIKKKTIVYSSPDLEDGNGEFIIATDSGDKIKLSHPPGSDLASITVKKNEVVDPQTVLGEQVETLSNTEIFKKLENCNNYAEAKAILKGQSLTIKNGRYYYPNVDSDGIFSTLAVEKDEMIKVYPDGGGLAVFLFHKNKKISGSENVKKYIQDLDKKNKNKFKSDLNAYTNFTVEIADFKTRAEEMNQSEILEELKNIPKEFDFSKSLKRANALIENPDVKFQNLGESSKSICVNFSNRDEIFEILQPLLSKPIKQRSKPIKKRVNNLLNALNANLENLGFITNDEVIDDKEVNAVRIQLQKEIILVQRLQKIIK